MEMDAIKNYKQWIRDGACTAPPADVKRAIEDAMFIARNVPPSWCVPTKTRFAKLSSNDDD